jgi:cytoskeletal protein CcmA (bactofilin family)
MLDIIPKLPEEPLGKGGRSLRGLGPSLLEAKKQMVISQSFALEGTIHKGGNLLIEGEFKGQIACDQVQIALKGKADAHIVCQQLVVRGTFLGKAHCHELIVNSSAYVDAHIEYVVMTIGSGAHMGGSLTARQPLPDESPDPE